MKWGKRRLGCTNKMSDESPTLKYQCPISWLSEISWDPACFTVLLRVLRKQRQKQIRLQPGYFWGFHNNENIDLKFCSFLCQFNESFSVSSYCFKKGTILCAFMLLSKICKTVVIRRATVCIYVTSSNFCIFTFCCLQRNTAIQGRVV